MREQNLEMQMHPQVSLEKDENNYVVKPASNSDIPMAGTYRSLVHNMVVGVSDGFEKKLTLVGASDNRFIAGWCLGPGHWV